MFLRTALIRVLFLFTTAASLICLFVYPALVAVESVPTNWMLVVFAGFMYLQLWMLFLVFGYESIAKLYGVRKRPFVPRVMLRASSRIGRMTWPTVRNRVRTAGRERRRLIGAIVLGGVSYILAVYGYALIYSFISHKVPASFNETGLSLITSVYFSLITIATVGYGDIAPKTDLARIVAMSEIVLGLCYTIFFFAIVASVLREGKTKPIAE